MSSILPTPPTALGPAPDKADPLRQVATQLETAFLSEMLKSSGLGEMSDSFSGGAGEEQFASFLRDEQAELMAARGGIGLAESIFQAMSRRGDGA